jgi:DNA-binding CsgD family transcriptional regulator
MVSLLELEPRQVPVRRIGAAHASLDAIHGLARKCRIPKQFKRLLIQVHSLIPYRSLLCAWGYPRAYRLCNILSIGYSKPFLRWYFTEGMIRKDPIFAEWLRTREPFVWSEVARRFSRQIDPEFVRKVREYQLQYSLCGGTIETMDHELGCYVELVLASEEECRFHMKYFGDLLPSLTHAFERSYPRGRLTKRESVVLELRAKGHQVKAIADLLDIAPRTVKMHIEAIKKKLYTDDLVNAVVIALKLGMIE